VLQVCLFLHAELMYHPTPLHACSRLVVVVVVVVVVAVMVVTVAVVSVTVVPVAVVSVTLVVVAVVVVDVSVAVVAVALVTVVVVPVAVVLENVAVVVVLAVVLLHVPHNAGHTCRKSEPLSSSTHRNGSMSKHTSSSTVPWHEGVVVVVVELVAVVVVVVDVVIVVVVLVVVVVNVVVVVDVVHELHLTGQRFDIGAIPPRSSTDAPQNFSSSVSHSNGSASPLHASGLLVDAELDVRKGAHCRINLAVARRGCGCARNGGRGCGGGGRRGSGRRRS